ncbi:MAG: hypothetical protein ABFE07_28395 [Armatimonadia bacterium]
MKDLRVGDLIELEAGQQVYFDVEERFVYQNTPRSRKLTHTEAVVGEPHGPPPGLYVVTRTGMEGGGTGMGPHDVFPDGWHVDCEKFDDPSVELDFYQSGCFTAMIKNVKVVGKCRRRWERVE